MSWTRSWTERSATSSPFSSKADGSVTISAPGATSVGGYSSADFAVPTTGAYVLAVTNGSATALSYGADLLEVPVDDDGMDVAELEALVEASGRTPKAI